MELAELVAPAFLFRVPNPYWLGLAAAYVIMTAWMRGRVLGALVPRFSIPGRNLGKPFRSRHRLYRSHCRGQTDPYHRHMDPLDPGRLVDDLCVGAPAGLSDPLLPAIAPKRPDRHRCLDAGPVRPDCGAWHPARSRQDSHGA